MPLNLPVFYTRTISSVFFVAIMLTGLLFNAMAFTLLIGVIHFLCMREYFRLLPLITPGLQRQPWQYVAIQVLGIFCIILYFNPENNFLSNYRIIHLFTTIIPVIPIMFFLIAIVRKNDAFIGTLQSFGGFLYISLPMIMLQYLYQYHSIYIPVTLIAFIWINDTMQYIIGSFFGKTPLSEISPKKTWEGTIGGTLLTVIVAIVAQIFIKIEMVNFIALALCAGIAGTFGDLLESKLKRMAGVKDSGTLMPGHGGALDRFDSLLVATPFACAVYMYHYF